MFYFTSIFRCRFFIDLEDITQETFLNAVRSASRFKGRSKPYTWLLSIAHHKISDYYRKLGREGRYETQSLDSIAGNQDIIADGSEPLDIQLESTEDNNNVAQALLKLPYHYREVLIYKYVEEMTVKQISQIMTRSPKSVEALLSRARNYLKNELHGINEG